jgi:chromosomal replication initiation ATPase DnaA
MEKPIKILQIQAECKEIKASLIMAPLYWTIRVSKIIKLTVCDHFGIDEEGIVGKCRKTKYVEAKRCYVWFMRHLTKCTMSVIGETINIPDHTSILNHFQRAEGLLEVHDEKFVYQVTRIYERLKPLLDEKLHRNTEA